MSHIYFVTIAIFEANKAAKTLLIENATEPQQLRVIKRCELILNVVQRLHPVLCIIMNNTTHEKSVRTQGDSSHGMINNSVPMMLCRMQNTLLVNALLKNIKFFILQVFQISSIFHPQFMVYHAMKIV